MISRGKISLHTRQNECNIIIYHKHLSIRLVLVFIFDKSLKFPIIFMVMELVEIPTKLLRSSAKVWTDKIESLIQKHPTLTVCILD